MKSPARNATTHVATDPPNGLVKDRVTGVILGLAVGDALGVPHKGRAAPAPGQELLMAGGGPGNYQPAEWSDDTQMAICVLQGAAKHRDLLTEEALDAVAASFIQWGKEVAADISAHTARVLTASPVAMENTPSRRSRAGAEWEGDNGPELSGNGSLARTSVVALPYLHDPTAAAAAAGEVASLTHADLASVDACLLWTEAVRRAALGEFTDLEECLVVLPDDRTGLWASRLARARDLDLSKKVLSSDSSEAILLLAWNTLLQAESATAEPADFFTEAVERAVRLGGDTATLAAVVGALAGAFVGAEAIPSRWTDVIHGWPSLDSTDLEDLALQAADSALTV